MVIVTVAALGGGLTAVGVAKKKKKLKAANTAEAEETAEANTEENTEENTEGGEQ